MTNSPPPDPRSSRVSFDEWVGIIVALGAIGAILALSLTQRERGLNFFSGLIPSERLPQTEPGTRENLPVPPLVAPPLLTPQQENPSLPQIIPTPSPQEPITAAPRAQEIPPLLPAIPVAPQTIASPKPTPVESVRFSDLPRNFWAYPYIEALTERGIFSGFPDGTFRPNALMTRAEFASNLKQAFEQKPTLVSPGFKDIPDDFWAAPAIKETTRTGFLRGYPDDLFRPAREIPRVQVLVALASGLELTPSTDPDKILQVYQDANQIPEYAKEQVAAATEAGLVVNYPNPQQLKPNEPATRAEVAAWMYQALVEAGKAPKITSEYTVEPQQ